MDSEDERGAVVAANNILDRAFGKPGLVKEEKDSLEERIANLTRQERVTRMRALLEPMRQYLHELDDARADAKVTPIRKRRSTTAPPPLGGVSRAGASPATGHRSSG